MANSGMEQREECTRGDWHHLTDGAVLGALSLPVFDSNPKVPVDTIRCSRCKKVGPRLEKAPFRNPIGERVHEEICQACWDDWLEHQTLLINHYGLDPRDPKAREFLYNQVETVLLKGEGGEGVDTSQKGNIEF